MLQVLLKLDITGIFGNLLLMRWYVEQSNYDDTSDDDGDSDVVQEDADADDDVVVVVVLCDRGICFIFVTFDVAEHVMMMMMMMIEACFYIDHYLN